MERFNLHKLNDVEVKRTIIRLKSQIGLQLSNTWVLIMWKSKWLVRV